MTQDTIMDKVINKRCLASEKMTAHVQQDQHQQRRTLRAMNIEILHHCKSRSDNKRESDNPSPAFSLYSPL